MVALAQVLASNARIPEELPDHLVTVFAGATSGIGRATLKAFVKYAVAPRVYLFARNTSTAAEVVAECLAINPSASFEIVKADLSSVRETHEACEFVKAREQSVNLVVLSMGEIRMDRALSKENLHLFLATVYYNRILIACTLLPLLTNATITPQSKQQKPLARILNIAGGTKEGAIQTSDLPALHIPPHHLRPHLSSMHTLTLEHLSKTAPSVSFVHDFPGAVRTPLFRRKNVSGWAGLMAKVLALYLWVFERWVCVPLGECGERHVYLGTSARYGGGSRVEREGGVSVGEGVDEVQATEVGGSVYSVDWDGEGPGGRVLGVLERLRGEGVREVVWGHVVGEFERILGT